MEEERIEELKNRPFFKLFPEKLEDLKKNKCTGCGNQILPFKDAISVREYRISGLCQNCQDKVFW